MTNSASHAKEEVAQSANGNSHDSSGKGCGCFSIMIFGALGFFVAAVIFGPERAIAAANSTFAYFGAILFGLIKWLVIAFIAIMLIVVILALLLGRDAPPNRDNDDDDEPEDDSPPTDGEGRNHPYNRLFKPDGTPRDFSMN